MNGIKSIKQTNKCNNNNSDFFKKKLGVNYVLKVKSQVLYSVPHTFPPTHDNCHTGSSGECRYVALQERRANFIKILVQ